MYFEKLYEDVYFVKSRPTFPVHCIPYEDGQYSIL